MEDRKFCCEQDKVGIQCRQIELAVVTEIGDYVNDGGGDEADNDRLCNKGGGIFSGKGRVLDNGTNIAQEDNRAEYGAEHEIGENNTQGIACYGELSRNACWQSVAAEDGREDKATEYASCCRDREGVCQHLYTGAENVRG